MMTWRRALLTCCLLLLVIAGSLAAEADVKADGSSSHWAGAASSAWDEISAASAAAAKAASAAAAELAGSEFAKTVARGVSTAVSTASELAGELAGELADSEFAASVGDAASTASAAAAEGLRTAGAAAADAASDGLGVFPNATPDFLSGGVASALANAGRETRERLVAALGLPAETPTALLSAVRDGASHVSFLLFVLLAFWFFSFSTALGLVAAARIWPGPGRMLSLLYWVPSVSSWAARSPGTFVAVAAGAAFVLPLAAARATRAVLFMVWGRPRDIEDPARADALLSVQLDRIEKKLDELLVATTRPVVGRVVG